MFMYVYIGTFTCTWVDTVGKKKGSKRSKVSSMGNQQGNTGIMRKKDYTKEENEEGGQCVIFF